MKKKASEMSVYEMVMAGLEESIAYSQGKLSLVTTRVPAPPPPMDARKVMQVRERLRMSQGVFAAALNVSPKTVQGWEQGLRTPSNASLRLLQIADQKPETVLSLMETKAERAPKARPKKTLTVKARPVKTRDKATTPR